MTILLAFTYEFFQHYWWGIISLLGAILVFLLFVQGGQTLIYQLGKTEQERSLIVNSLGRKWEFTFTTLVTFGGAFFASFPLFYSTSFGGAYWVWMLILFCFVIQTTGYEFRNKPNNFLGKRVYEWFLLINGFVGTIALGAAVGSFFSGSEFLVNKDNITNIFSPGGSLTISEWKGAAHGLELLLIPQNVILGLAVFFLARLLGGMYLINSIDSETITSRARQMILPNAILFLVSFLTFLALILTSQGFAVDPGSGVISMEPYKYLHNFIEMPVIALVFLLGVVGVLWGIGTTLFCKGNTKGIWFSGAGTICTVFALFAIAGYNHTAYYPSTFDLQSSLTIQNSSSSLFTLKVMSIVSLLIPFVLAYIIWAWSSMNKKKIRHEDLEKDEMKY